jgi:SAM-dependent methyltransferase
MGDANQLLFVESLADKLTGPVLEVGSRDYGNTQNFRETFGGADYLGIDMQDGKGVDLVLDLTADFEYVDLALKGRRFGVIICMSVLEHCRNPFKMARNIEMLLADGGTLLVGVPFVWELHGFPDDYWRFTPSGIRVLFSNLDFSGLHGMAFSGRKGDSTALDSDLFCIKFSSKNPQTRKLLGALPSNLIGLLRKLGLMKKLFGHRCVFPSVMVNMVGRKPSSTDGD